MKLLSNLSESTTVFLIIIINHLKLINLNKFDKKCLFRMWVHIVKIQEVSTVYYKKKALKIRLPVVGLIRTVSQPDSKYSF